MRYKVIAIEREYASGGTEIGQKLAAKLGIPCYGRELLEMAANKMGVRATELEAMEESVTGSLLYSFYMLASVADGKDAELTTEQKLTLTESDIILHLALKPCVIVGRCAADVLRSKDHVLKAFIHADYDTRVKRAVEVYQNDAKQAESVLHRFDKRRANFFKSTAGVDWKDEDTYHLFLNSGMLGIDVIVDILCEAVQ